MQLLQRAVAGDSVPPAMLFAGPAGVGKRRTAGALAEALNCLARSSGGEGNLVDACGTCAACKRIARGAHPDVRVVEPGESGAIKVEQAREVIDQVGYRPFEGRRRVVIIDQADAMVPAAQNAFLKTLEEPPSASIFVLVTAIADSLLPTVRSRCPRLRFAPLSAAEVAAVLMRDHGYGEAEARAAAAEADGSIGLALAVAAEDVTGAREEARQLLRTMGRITDPGRRLEHAKTLTPPKGSPGGDRDHLAAMLRSAASLLRDLGILATKADPAMLANSDLRLELEALADGWTAERVQRAFGTVDRAAAALDRNVSPKVVADWLVLEL